MCQNQTGLLCVGKNSVADPEPVVFDPWIRDPGCKKNPEPESGMNILDLIFENLVSVFCLKNT
jgi:hypothetical protein